jgi:hypothetical protein
MKSSLPLGLITLTLASAITSPVAAQVVDPFYSGTYTLTDLGSVPGVSTPYGGLTLLAGNPNTLLIGGAANTANGQLFSIGVTRDGAGHITGFTGSASVFAAAAYNDGGVAYGPGGNLFLARWPVNELGQTKPGSNITDKVINLAPFGVAGSAASLAFVPATHNGAGQMKLVSYSGGQWYTIGLAPDGTGTYDVTSATLETTIVGGPEGIAYVPIGSALFTNQSLLVAEYGAGNVVTYEIDANGDPIVATRKIFISGLSGAEGAFIDPLTGDFLFSTFGGGNKVIRVSGFSAPPQPPAGVPDAGSTALLALVSAGFFVALRRRWLVS